MDPRVIHAWTLCTRLLYATHTAQNRTCAQRRTRIDGAAEGGNGGGCTRVAIL